MTSHVTYNNNNLIFQCWYPALRFNVTITTLHKHIVMTQFC